MKILVICPSRGRPDAISQVWYSGYDTARHLQWDFQAVVDDNDPKVLEYKSIGLSTIIPSQGSMCGALNHFVQNSDLSDYDILGFVGDDHRFKTENWPDLVRANLTSPGILYGPDGSDNIIRELPTFWFISREIVDALGWFALPDCKHFYLDDAWRDLGKATDTLRYDPSLYIEHLHFSFNKSQHDETYAHTMRVGREDSLDYARWRDGHQFMVDVEKIRSVL